MHAPTTKSTNTLLASVKSRLPSQRAPKLAPFPLSESMHGRRGSVMSDSTCQEIIGALPAVAPPAATTTAAPVAAAATGPLRLRPCLIYVQCTPADL